MKREIVGWGIDIGLYPGILIGARSYPEENFVEHVLYIPFIELCITIDYKEI